MKEQAKTHKVSLGVGSKPARHHFDLLVAKASHMQWETHAVPIGLELQSPMTKGEDTGEERMGSFNAIIYHRWLKETLSELKFNEVSLLGHLSFSGNGNMAPLAALQATFLSALLFLRTHCGKGKMWKEQ